MGQRVHIALFIVVALAHCAQAWNFTFSTENDDRRVIDVGVFGYAPGGSMTLKVKRFDLKEKDELRTTNEKIGFTLDLVPTAVYARQEKNYARSEGERKHLCFIDDPAVQPQEPTTRKWRHSFPLQKQLADGTAGGWSRTVEIITPGLYALFFYNCKRYDSDMKSVHATFSIEVSQFNIDESGAVNYLSVGEFSLPVLYFAFFALFAAGVVLWLRLMKRNERSVHKIHWLMLVLAILKALTLFFEAIMYQSRKSAGHITTWDYLYYFFQTLKGVALFTVILLLGSGWSFLRPFLSERDTRVLVLILPLQIVVNIALAVLEEHSEGARNWATWRDTLRIIDVICCCAVLFPVIASIKNLRDATGADGKSSRALSQLSQFRTFYIAVVAFIYFTRIGVVLIDSALPYNLTWLSHLLRESAAFAFYCYSGSKFRPAANNENLKAEIDDAEELDLREEDEDETSVS